MSKERPRWTLRRSARDGAAPEWLEAARRRIEEANRADPSYGTDAGRVALRSPRRGPDKDKSTAKKLSAEPDVPPGLKIAGDYSWRIAVVILVSAGVFWGLSQVSTLVIPLMVAALLAGLLRPFKNLLRQRLKWPNGLSVAATFVLFLVVVGGALWLVGSTMAHGARDLVEQARAGLAQIQDWFANGPLHVTTEQVDSWVAKGVEALQNNSSEVFRSAASGVSVLTHLGAGLLLTFFALIFFLLEGERIWRWVSGLFPRKARPAVDGAGRQGWKSLVSYVRVQLVVALIDAIGIGAGAAILQVPLALPLSVLVFLGSFIPILGALLTGAIAVLLALVAHGWVIALIMLGVVLLVQQVESHILQPLIMGRAVSLHPLAVVLAVAGGSLLFGIAGALFAVPVIAVVNTVVKYLATRAWERDPAVSPVQDPETAASPDVPDSPATEQEPSQQQESPEPPAGASKEYP